MLELLKVEKGEKVAAYYYNHKDELGKILAIYTVLNQTEKGNISAANDRQRLNFDKYGFGKGNVSLQRIRKLKEGEEETFLELLKQKRAAEKAEFVEKEAQKAREYDKCYQWVRAHYAGGRISPDPLVDIELWIVNLPIPNEPCTLIIRFEKRPEYIGEYAYDVRVWENATRNGYISSGMMTMNSSELAPLKIAAAWMATWVNVSKLGVENVA